jgi:hypothetical protein
MTPAQVAALPLQTNFGMLPHVTVPAVGAAWLIGGIFLGHIIFGTLSMGIVMLAPTFELLGRLRGQAWMDRYANSLASTNLKLFSFGATLAAFAVTVMAPLYSKLFVRLWTIFWLPMLTAFLSWPLTVTLLLLYVYRWRRMSVEGKGRHIALGYAGGLSEHLFLFLIVGVDSFMLTPVRSFSWQAVFNATFWEELFHRFFGNMSWVLLFAAAVMLLYGRAHRDGDEVELHYYSSAATWSLSLGFLLLVPQAISGFFFAEAIKGASPGAFTYSFTGPFAWLWQLQQAFFAVLLISANVFFLQSTEEPRMAGLLVLAVVVLFGVFMILPSAWYLGYFWVRYIFTFAALLLTVGHWAMWTRIPHPRRFLRGSGRGMMTLAGVVALFLILLMGTIRETARGPYTIYGVQTQQQGSQLFEPPKGFYP